MSVLTKAEIFIAGPSEFFSLEHRVFNLSSFIITIFGLQGMIINYALGLNMVTVWLSFIGVVISVLIFYLSRYKYRFTPTIIFLYTIATILVLGFMHFFNAGSYGPMIYLFVMLMNIYLLISQKAHQLIIYAMLSVTVLLLLLIEYLNPELVVPYRNESERLIDHITCILYSMFFTMLVIRIFKNSYNNDRALIIAQKNELEEAFDVTTRKNQYIESLIKEIHHRVKNNLQVISSLMLLQSNRIDNEEAREALEEGRSRVSTIALVHQKLYMDNELAKVNIKEYLDSLSESIALTYGHESATIQTEIALSDNLLDIDIAIPIGLIVNELVSNCFKHAFNNCPHPKIIISLNRDNQGVLILTVSDNGTGMDNQEEISNSSSFGMKLVAILVKQLKGNVIISSDNGTIISIELQEKYG